MSQVVINLVAHSKQRKFSHGEQQNRNRSYLTRHRQSHIYYVGILAYIPYITDFFVVTLRYSELVGDVQRPFTGLKYRMVLVT
jgi:hypothetical protein